MFSHHTTLISHKYSKKKYLQDLLKLNSFILFISNHTTKLNFINSFLIKYIRSDARNLPVGTQVHQGTSPNTQSRRSRNHQRGQTRVLWSVQAGNRWIKQNKSPQSPQNRGEVQVGRLEEAWQDEQGRCHEKVRGKTDQDQPKMEPQGQTMINHLIYRINNLTFSLPFPSSNNNDEVDCSQITCLCLPVPILECPSISGSNLRQLNETNNSRTRNCSTQQTILRVKPSSLSSSVFSNKSRRLKMFNTERHGTGRHLAKRLEVSLDQKTAYMLAQVWWIAGQELVLSEIEVFVMCIAAFLAIRIAPHIFNIYRQYNSPQKTNSIIFKQSKQTSAIYVLSPQKFKRKLLRSYVAYPSKHLEFVVNEHIFLAQYIKYFKWRMKFQEKLKQVEGKLFINGKYVQSKGKAFDVFNPATEEVIGKSISATPEEVDLAVAKAREAFNSVWRNYDAAQRGRHLNKLADLIEANAEWLTYFETLNNGKTITASTVEDIPVSVSVIRHFAGMADKIKGKTLQMQHPFIGMTIKQPIGVVGQIIPWNYPILMMVWKIAPALAAGCTIVLKPAEQTPFTALMLGNLINQAGFPPGVINILPGWGETGACISQHKGIDKISFTGSTEVGYIIMRTSHKENLKPVTLELGGKSANIICPDADLDIAAEQACILFGNCGQSCVAGSRTFVHQSIYDKFVEKCIQIAKKIKVGDPMDKNTTQGAIISKEQFDKILMYIGEGKKEGAKVVIGGNRHGEKGFFVQPTIFIDVQDHMRIAREEIFGPVMSIFKWNTEEEVIARANSLPYGLGAGVVTPNIDRALRFVNKLHAGTVYVNCYDYTQGVTPFGGYKDSGIGKDLGDQGLESYLLTKTVILKQHQV